MLTLQEKQKLTRQLKALKEQRAGLEHNSSNRLDENSGVKERLKNLQKNQIRLQSKIARMKKNGSILQAKVPKDGAKLGKPGKVMLDKKMKARCVTNKDVSDHGASSDSKLGKPGKVMLDKKMKAKDKTPHDLGKKKETKAYEGFDPDLLECIKRRDAWDKLASHYIYEADEIYNDNQSPFQGQEGEDDDFDLDINIDADGQQKDQDEQEGDESEEEVDLVQELKLLNQKINQLKQFADSITPDELKDAEEQQSKLQQIVDDDEEGEEGQEGQEDFGLDDEEGMDMQGGESQGIEGLDDEEAISLQGQEGQEGQDFKGELGADALSNIEMGGSKNKKKKNKSPEIAMEDVREAILRRNFWDSTAKNLIRLEEYCSNLKENDEEDKVKAVAALSMGVDGKDVEKEKEELLKTIGEADDPFLPPEAVRVELSSDSGVDNSSVGELSSTELCACGVPGCGGKCSISGVSIGTDIHPSFTNESAKKQITLQQNQIKNLKEELKKLKFKK